MLKILLLLSMIFIPLSSNDEVDFLKKVKSSYDEYMLYEIYEPNPENYSLTIIRGRIKDQYTYGIKFEFSKSIKYQLFLVDSNNNEYKLKTDSSGQINIIALEVDKPYSVAIYENGKKVPLGKNISLVPFKSISSDYLKGSGEGSNIESVKAIIQLPSLDYVVIGGAIMIGSSLIIIFAFYRLKKGMFNKEVRTKDVFNFKEFLDRELDEKRNDQFEIIDLEENEVEIEESKEEKEIYEKTYTKYIDNLDEGSNFPLKEYLIEKGFIADYRLASEDEKQLIMLELMKLKNDGKITMDEYYEEAYKLWKK